MSLRVKVMELVKLVLRVPPLIIIDEILKLGLGLGELHEHDLSDQEDFGLRAGRLKSPEMEDYKSPYSPFYQFIIMYMIRLVLSSVGKYVP